MAKIENPITLNLDDIQGMVIKGYPKLSHTAYICLKINSPCGVKEKINEWLPSIDSAVKNDSIHSTLHIAFGASGLKKIGLKEENINTFPHPFREGMSTEYRSRILGDFGDNDSNNWIFGKENEVDLLLVLHEKERTQLEEKIEEYRKEIVQTNLCEELHCSTGYLKKDHREPFGFRDGISQPVIKGSGKTSPENDLIETGEFLMGYKNEHHLLPDSPKIVASQGNKNLLQNCDLGLNGSFLVYRKLEQHVDRFWKEMEKHSKNPDGSIDEEAKIKLASKCIGRWPSGAPLAKYPDKDPGGLSDDDDFGYVDGDKDGLKCPFGSHLRRSNPRDTHRNYSKEQSLKITKRHRIMRRGRTYLEESNGTKEEGLQFLCFNANLELQFEFIQHQWANNNQMPHLDDDVDPIIGVPKKNEARNFTIQQEPVSKFLSINEQFITVKGGGYFFFPSISAISYLTTL